MTLLRTILLTSMGALALAACGESKTDPAKEQEVVAKVAPPAGKSWSELVRVDGDGLAMGNPEAPIKPEEFGYFPCGHCANFTPDSHEALKRQLITPERVPYKR